MPQTPSERDASRPALWRAEDAFLMDLLTLRERTPKERANAFRRLPLGSVEDRWHIYAHGYFARITDALAGEYPAVQRILGEDAFAALACRYLAACPPRSFDLAHAGDSLPRFLRTDAGLSGLPFLADLATLERRLAEAFVAADATPIAWSELRAMPAETVADLPLRLLPGTAFVRSKWPLYELWKARHSADEEVFIELDRVGLSTVLVYRRGLVVRCERIGEREADVLAAASLGDTTLDELAARMGPSADSQGLLLTFKKLVEQGLFTKTGVPGYRTPQL